MSIHHGAALVVTESHGFYTARVTIDRIPQPDPQAHVVFRESVSAVGTEEELREELNRRARRKAEALHIGNIEGIV